MATSTSLVTRFTEALATQACANPAMTIALVVLFGGGCTCVVILATRALTSPSVEDEKKQQSWLTSESATVIVAVIGAISSIAIAWGGKA